MRHRTQLPESPFEIQLGLDNYTLRGEAEVRWTQELGNGVNEFGCAFRGLSLEDSLALTNFMEKRTKKRN